ncbi:hypothetical protein DFH09DRAFT_1081824 [Mycena vulgaris]|nr:hypothetical protein DFH09DRAFT_1081824 [Mycena vulgaris]
MPTRYSRYSSCEDCPIFGGYHEVPTTAKVTHALEVRAARELAAQRRESSDTPIPPLPSKHLRSDDENGLLGGMTRLTLNDSGPNQQPSEPSDSETDHGLPDMMTALILTDDGPNPHQQPSKLFSPRDEFQEMRAPNIPDNLRPIPLAQASRSITTLLTHRMPVSRKKNKGKDILIAIREEVQAALTSLDLDVHLERPEEVAAMHSTLDAAASAVVAAGESLQNLAGNYHLKELRDEVVSEVQVLDRHIDVVSARLPPLPDTPNTGPMQCSAADLDLIAQMTLLLVVVCNVIIRLGSNPCNFILGTVRAIIELVMSLNVPPGGECDAQQSFVLDQLPTNLEAALKAFKIDSKTIIYAVCPSCSFTHAPIEDKVTGALTYPSACQNTIAGIHGSVDCSMDLLELRHNKMRPIKIYVFPSFEEYIARLLADPKIEEMCDRACDVAMASARETPESVTNVPYEWMVNDPSDNPKKPKHILSPKEEVENQVQKIQTKLIEAISPADGEPGTNWETLEKSLLSNNLRPLRFVANSLHLEVAERQAKADYADALIDWVSFSNPLDV